MKIQCDVCESNKATVICCADEAALCTDCDTRVHAANKLANKHQRVPLMAPTDAPRCDICQEKSGFFFCVEDRALLCRDCDLSIHSANSLSSRHKRFLIPGIRVAWKALTVQEEPDAASEETPQFSLPTSKTSGMMNPVMSGRLSSTAQPPLSSPVNHPMPQSKNQGGFVPKVGEVMGTSLSTGPQSGSGTLRKSSITEFLTEATSGWRVDELLNLADLAEGYNAANVGSSKADVANFGDFDWTADLSLFDEETLCEVPQLPSPPTASGLSRSTRMIGTVKTVKQEVALVPDFGDAFTVPNLHLDVSPPSSPLLKRRRSYYDM
ncbi:unnamed protein product [Sphagnum jensenii]|uniref:B box-type domain-containing protein n=1 Tax=Sphagnum jensenii TaxID=128206 RepID=A0ABP1BY11_9BRYO